MAHWQHKIDISDLWNASEPRGGTLTAQQLAAQVAERLQAQMSPKLHGHDAFEMTEIIETFVALSEDGSADFDDLDQVYSDLCDFGDFGHRLWVKTF